MNFSRKFLMLISTAVACLFTVNAFADRPYTGYAVTGINSVESSKPGEEALLSAVYNDPEGWQDLKWVLLSFWPIGDTDPTKRIWCMYRLDDGKFYLYDHDLGRYVAGSGPGGSGVIETRHAILNCRRGAVSGEGDTVTATFALTFKETLAGERCDIYQHAMDISGLRGRSKDPVGTWDIKKHTPRVLRFQGMLKDSGGALVDGEVALTFRLYDTDDTTSGALPLWEEAQATVLVESGLVDVELGNGTPLEAPFDTQYWLGVQVDADEEMSPRFKLTSVPYAVEAD